MNNYYRTMKKCLFLFFLGMSSISIGQTQETTKLNSFYIENTLTPDQTELYSERITKGNFESFRLKNTPTVLVFEEGFKCILIPASKLADFDIDSNNYQESFPSQFILPTFRFTENGGIVSIYQKSGK